MSLEAREIGTLIVVVLKAKNLPNKRHIGKQDPYCTLKLNNETRRTKAVKRGGQHPEWDEEIRFTLLEDVEDELARTEASTAPPPPKKEGKHRKVQGGKIMRLSCYADDPREPEYIGETQVDLGEVLTKGETDEWFTLLNKEKYSGEVYLELTFWSNEKPPPKRENSTPSVVHPQYGGPGSFTPSAGDGDLPESLRIGHGKRPGSVGGTESPGSRVSSSSSGKPASLVPGSSSLADLNLYIPPYERTGGQGTVGTNGYNRPNTQDNLSEFGVAPRRRESFPAPGAANGGYSDPYGFTVSSNSTYSAYSRPESVADSLSSLNINDARPYAGHGPRSSLGAPYQSPYPPPSQYPSSIYSPVQPSGFLPPPSATPAPSGFQQRPPPVSSGFFPPRPGATPAPSGFLPPPSSMGFHPPQPAATPVPYHFQQPPPPAPPSSAPPQQFSPHYPQPPLGPHSAPTAQPSQYFSPPPAPTPAPVQPSYGAQPQQPYQQQFGRPLPDPSHGLQPQSPHRQTSFPPGQGQPGAPSITYAQGGAQPLASGIMFPSAMPYQQPQQPQGAPAPPPVAPIAPPQQPLQTQPQYNPGVVQQQPQPLHNPPVPVQPLHQPPGPPPQLSHIPPPPPQSNFQHPPAPPPLHPPQQQYAAQPPPPPQQQYTPQPPPPQQHVQPHPPPPQQQYNHPAPLAQQQQYTQPTLPPAQQQYTQPAPPPAQQQYTQPAPPPVQQQQQFNQPFPPQPPQQQQQFNQPLPSPPQQQQQFNQPLPPPPQQQQQYNQPLPPPPQQSFNQPLPPPPASPHQQPVSQNPPQHVQQGFHPAHSALHPGPPPNPPAHLTQTSPLPAYPPSLSPPNRSPQGPAAKPLPIYNGAPGARPAAALPAPPAWVTGRR